MEGASESCPSAVPAGAPAAEQPPAEPRESDSTEPSGEALLHPAAGAMQADEGCKLPDSWEQAGAALREAPGEGLRHQEMMGDGNQGVLEPENLFSASPENASPDVIRKSSTLPELRSSEREKETSQNASLSENVTSSTGTGKEVVKMLDITALKEFFSSI